MMMNVVELSGVRKTFVDFWLRPTVKAVDGLDLQIAAGEVFGLLGPNGSGKSTTIKMILGLLRPSAGTVRLFGFDPRSQKARSRLGYLPELSYLHPFLTARETLKYYAGLCGLDGATANARTDELLEMVGLTDVAGRAVGGFSKGMARRVALASSLIGKPELLILDEPTSGLDPVSRDELLDILLDLRKDGIGILFSTHIISDLERAADRIIYIRNGNIAADRTVGEFESDYRLLFYTERPEGIELIGERAERDGFTALVKSETGLGEKAGLEDIMLHLERSTK